MTPSPSSYQPERRPIASRDKAASQRAARWLARHGVSANAVSVAGMLAGLTAGGALALTSIAPWPSTWFLMAAILMQLRLAANMLDGMVASESHTVSRVGELYNEVPDRVADAAMFIGAGYAAHSLPELGFLAACLALFVAYVRAAGKVAGGPQQYVGPLAKPQRVFVMTLTAVLCAALPNSVHVQIESIQPAGFSGGLLAWVLLGSLIGMSITSTRRLRRTAVWLRQEVS